MKRTMLYLRSMLAVCLLAVGFAACSDDDDEKVPSTFAFEATDMVCLSAASTSEINFTAPESWTATTSIGWIKLSKTSGMGMETVQTIDVTVDENKGVEDRKGTITLKLESGQEVTINVTQYGINETLVFFKDQVDLVIDNENNTIQATVDVLCNYDYSVTIPSDASAWLSCEKTENADKENRTVLTFTADASKLTDYAAKEVAVKVAYAPSTRALPADKTLKVVFPGITPELTYYTRNDNGDKVNVTKTSALITKQEGNEDYNVVVTVASNFKWILDETSVPEWLTVTMNGENSSTDFFTTENQIILTLNEQTDERLNGELKFNMAGAKSGAYETALKVRFNGVGGNFVQFNLETLQDEVGKMDSNTANIMFPATGETKIGELWGDVIYGSVENFTITTNLADVAFFVTKVSNNFEPKAFDVTKDWAFVTEVTTPATRALGQRTYQLGISNRSENEWEYKNGSYQSVGTEMRFFALFAVPTTNLVANEWTGEYSADDLFSHTGMTEYDGDILKDEYKDCYITLGQYGMEKNYTFEPWQVVVGEEASYDCSTINVPAAGASVTISYNTTAATVEEAAWNINLGVEGELGYEWSGTALWNWTDEFTLNDANFTSTYEYYETVNKLTFTVPANTTGVARALSCGISSYALSNADGKEKLVYKFIINQSAE